MGLTPVSATTTVREPDEFTDVPMDGYGRYLIPHPAGNPDGLADERRSWTRVSTIKGRTQDSEALEVWNRNMLAKGLAISPDLIALAAATPLGDKKVLAEIVDQAQVRAGARAAANFGSALHAYTDQIDSGTLDLNDEATRERIAVASGGSVLRDLDAYVNMLKRYRLRPVPGLIERAVVIPALRTGSDWRGVQSTHHAAASGAGGTFDRMYAWTDGDRQEWLIPGDLKSGRNAIEYGSIETAVQLGSYVHAEAIWNEETKSFEPMPTNLRQDVGLLIHLPVGSGTCEPEVLDLEFGWWVAQLGVMLLQADKGRERCHWPMMTAGANLEPPAPKSKAKRQAATVPVPAGVIACGPDGAVAELTPSDAAVVEEFRQQLVKAAPGALAPLAGPGERGCSVCRRKGHRKGSSVCLGDQDPARKTVAGTATAEQTAEVAEAEMNAAERRRLIDQEMSDGDHDTRASAARAVDARLAQTFPDPDADPDADLDAPTEGPGVDWCPRSGPGEPGTWSRNPAAAGTPQEWVCSTCGLPAQEVLLAGGKPLAVEHQANMDAFAAAPPLGTPTSQDPRAPYRESIRKATTVAQVKAIREEAKAAGLWEGELLDYAMSRLPELTSEA